MIASRPNKTFADYAAVAVCPVLIMLAVGSLIFYLLAVGYAGSHPGVLRWTFFWFVLAMVLVSRIAIERGSEHAWLYGLALAAATAFRLLQYVAFNLWMWVLLALIWWATNKLTWDCTVIDDDQDASGQGLLRAAKLDSSETGPRSAEATASPELETGTKADARKPSSRSSRKEQAKAKAPHAPGLWVIYFSLGALPIFGLGQGLIPRQDTATRQYAFSLLVLYLGAALGLLLITSFLGLRRYLRQRRLAMPPAMSATWLTTGAGLAIIVLAGCLLLPRPDARWSLPAMMNRLEDAPPKVLQHKSAVARFAGNAPEVKTDQAREGAGERPSPGGTTESSAAAQRATGPATPGETKQESNHASTGQNVEQAESAAPGGNDSGIAQPSAPPQLKLSLRTPLKLLRVAIYVGLALLGFFIIVHQREQILKTLQEFWRSLAELWSGLFARESAPAATVEAIYAAGPRRAFTMLNNPFASGAAAQMPVEDLIVQSFNGLEAWAQEHQCGRQPDETPLEFAERIAREFPDLAHEAEQLARLYVQVAYAKAAALPACRTLLEILWSKMTLRPGM